jgi:carboxyl-terminal processing protease
MLRVLVISLILVCSGTSLFAEPIVLEKRERDRLKKETVYAIDLIQRYHYKQKSFSEIDAEDLLRKYIDDLDSSRIFFLEEDVEFAVTRFSGSLKPSYLYVGDLFPAFEIFNIYMERVEERLAWIDERLQQPFDFESDKAYLTDREDAPWPKSKKEADDLWDKRLTNELLMEILEDEPMDRALDRIVKRYERMEKFINEIEIHNVQETFLTSLAQLYDPHSNFFSWDSAQEFDIQISNALVGIGAQLRDVDGYCVIERLIPGGPAEMTGTLHPGDKIVAVGQGETEPVDVVGMKLRKIVQMIRGETGTEVRLTVIPAHSAKRKVITLNREKVELTANLASADLFEVPDESGATKKIGVIELPSFYGEGAFGEGSISTSRDVEELINKLKDQEVEGLVLDLRNNGGGRLDEAIKLTGLFISKGPVVMKRSFDGEVEEDWDQDQKIAWNGPLVVLVSRSSASASEIVAGALQSLGRAVVVGDKATHGKGTVQAPIDLRSTMRALPFSEALEVGTVKITVQQFYLPNGDSTQSRGVMSDISLPSANMFLFDGEADLDNALSWDHISPIVYQLPERGNPDFTLVQNNLLEDLGRKSSLRQEESEEFNFLKENIAWFKERHDLKFVSLNLEERRKDKELVESMQEIFEDRRDELSKNLTYDVEAVKLELTKEKEASHQDKLASTPLPGGESRPNQFYQKVFYYQESPDEKIHEIWVEYFDYEKALEENTSIATVLSESSGIEISAEDTAEILKRFKNRDRGTDFNVMDPFTAVLGEDLDQEAILGAMPAFFGKLVEIDPDILLERSKLDIPLRESLHIVRDWIEVESPLNPTKIAANVVSIEDEMEETASTP